MKVKHFLLPVPLFNEGCRFGFLEDNCSHLNQISGRQISTTNKVYDLINLIHGMLLKSRKFLLLDIVPSREKCKISNPHKNEKYAKKKIYIKNEEERPQEKSEVPIP